MDSTSEVAYRRSPTSLFRRSLDSYVVASPARPGLVLLEGALARAWDCLQAPLSTSQLGVRLEPNGVSSSPSSNAALIIEHLLALGLVAVDNDESHQREPA
jgi:hypothetical protein